MPRRKATSGGKTLRTRGRFSTEPSCCSAAIPRCKTGQVSQRMQTQVGMPDDPRVTAQGPPDRGGARRRGTRRLAREGKRRFPSRDNAGWQRRIRQSGQRLSTNIHDPCGSRAHAESHEPCGSRSHSDFHDPCDSLTPCPRPPDISGSVAPSVRSGGPGLGGRGAGGDWTGGDWTGRGWAAAWIVEVSVRGATAWLVKLTGGSAAAGIVTLTGSAAAAWIVTVTAGFRPL